MIARTVRTAVTVIAALAAAVLATPGIVPAAGAQTLDAPWIDAPPFGLPADELLASAEEVSTEANSDVAEASVLVLWRSDEYRFTADGSLRYRRHWIYRILEPEALEAWGVSETRLSPWHQQTPRLRARVISPDGESHTMEGDVEGPLPSPEDPLADQRLVMRTALPGVEVGAVVEEVMELDDRQPLFAGGVAYRHPLVLPVPIHRGRVVLDAPTSLPLRFGVRAAPGVEPIRSLDDGRVRLVFRYADQPAAGPVEPWQETDRPRFPHVAFSTGESWSAVGQALVETLAAAGVPMTAPTTEPASAEPAADDEPGDAAIARIAPILAELRREVAAIDRPLHSAPFVPTAAPELLRRGRGDSLDLAALLVTRLRAAGLPAWVALVSTGHGQDVELRLPGLGLFDHALVYVPAGRAIWIDPSDRFSRAGQLPARASGRWALVANPTVRQLIRTPEPRPVENRSIYAVDVHLADSGAARIVEKGVFHGEIERAQRRLTADLSPEDRRRAYLDYVRSIYRAGDLGAMVETEPFDLAEPYRLELEALASELGQTDGSAGEATFELLRGNLLLGLPLALLRDTREPRRTPFVFRLPFETERRIILHPPPGYLPGDLPEDASFDVGTGHLEQTVRQTGDGRIEITQRFTSGPIEITPEEFQTYRQDARRLLREKPVAIRFEASQTDR